MNASQATLAMVLLFVLRCLAPLMLMFIIGYAMNWLVGHWEMEDLEPQAESTGRRQLNQQPIQCWRAKKCSPQLRKNCPGFKQPTLPCWLARTREEGGLPSECLSCPVYHQKISFEKPLSKDLLSLKGG